jgi:uncharacterized protein YbaR (Trm112 family)
VTVTNPAQSKAGQAGQIICPLCRTKRFFVYVAEGEIEVTCTECGARIYDLTDGRMVPAQP